MLPSEIWSGVIHQQRLLMRVTHLMLLWIFFWVGGWQRGWLER